MGGSIVFLGDKLPEPTQKGIRRDDAGNLVPHLRIQGFRLDRQTTTLVVRERDATSLEVFLVDADLLFEILDGLLLAPVDPAGNK